MKGQSDKTKVVVRHLPPSITQATLMEQIDGAFAARYNWVSFRPGKTSHKHQYYSRAYIDFKRPEDVFDFAEFFNGHLFVSEKGTQFKAIVEYAPSQRVPKQWTKKDGREGTISRDPEYLEFLEFISKPVENLPSAEIQLERREAERTGSAKEAPIVTPLMNFVRQKRAAKSGPRRILSNGKLSRRAGAGGSPGSSSSKRGSEKKKTPTTMYVLRDSAKSTSGKDKQVYTLISKRDDLQLSDKASTASGAAVLDNENGISGITDAGKRKILLLKGKEKEVYGTMSKQQNAMSSDRSLSNVTSLKSQHRESSDRMIRNILLNKELRQNPSTVQSEPQIQSTNLEKEKRPPRPPHVQMVLKDSNGAPDDKVIGNDSHGFFSDKQEKRTRNKDRLDRVVWLRRSDGSYASDESSSHSSQLGLDASQGNHGETKVDFSRSGEVKTPGSGRNNHDNNGSHKQFSRRGASSVARDADGSSLESKPSKRSSASGHGSHEKQVWVQKSSSGS